MKRLPGAIFIIDTIKEHIALKEARKLGIPTVAVVDTNSDPTDVTHVIPGNDDALRSVGLFTRLMADSCLEGAAEYQEKLKSVGSQEEEEVNVEKKVSRFEGDLDITGLDVAELKAQEEQEKLLKEAEGTEVDGAAAAATETEKSE